MTDVDFCRLWQRLYAVQHVRIPKPISRHAGAIVAFQSYLVGARTITKVPIAAHM